MPCGAYSCPRTGGRSTFNSARFGNSMGTTGGGTPFATGTPIVPYWAGATAAWAGAAPAGGGTGPWGTATGWPWGTAPGVVVGVPCAAEARSCAEVRLLLRAIFEVLFG